MSGDDGLYAALSPIGLVGPASPAMHTGQGKMQERPVRCTRGGGDGGRWPDQRAVHRGEKIRCKHPKCTVETLSSGTWIILETTPVYGVPLRCSELLKQRRQKNAKHRQMSKAKSPST